MTSDAPATDAALITLLAAPPGTVADARRQVAGRLPAGSRVLEVRELAPVGDGGRAGQELVVAPPDGQPVPELVRLLRRELARDRPPALPVGGATADDRPDVAVTAASTRTLPRLVVLDVDSTLIGEEVVELLAAHAGREAEVAAVTAAAMRGELDFAQSLHARVAALAGLPERVLADVRDAVRPTPGARDLCRHLAARGIPVGVVSGGFAEVVRPLAADLGIPTARANRLEVSGGRLTGRVLGAMVDAAAKERFLHDLAGRHGVPAAGTVAVGDGANDALMVQAAGTGVAFCARPYLVERADVVLRHRDLRSVLQLVTG